MMGVMLLIAGLLIAAAGLALMFPDVLPFLGKLPGDITIKRGNFRLFIPIATSLLLSILLTGILWLFQYLRRK